MPAVAAKGARWLPPFGSPLEISGPYKPPATRYGSGHRGIDLPAAPGDTPRAPVAGIVSFVGTVADRAVLSIQVDDRTVVSFEPLEQPEDEGALKKGDTVARGQQLGIVADGGHCYAECLHLGVRVNGEYVNPLRYFYAAPVLLPW